MAGNWYRDEDRGSGNQHRGGGDRGGDDRGFFERAGEEVRSWFGDDEGQHRHSSGGHRDRPRDEPWGGGDWTGTHSRNSGGSGRGQDRGHAQSWGEANDGNSGRGSSRYGNEHGHGGFQGDYGGGAGQGGFGGQGDYRGGRQSFSGGGGQGSHPDDHYRSWRDRQIEQMDREYDEYCRERQQSFHNDFHSWRQNRQSQGGSGLGTSASTGSTGSGLVAGSGGTTGGGDEGRGGTASSRTDASLGSTDESGAGASGGAAEKAASGRSKA